MNYLNKIFGTFFLLFLYTISYSQNKSVVINYEEIGMVNGKNIITDAVLVHNINESMYIISEKETTNISKKDGNKEVRTVTKIPFQLYYKSYEKDTLITQIGQVNSLSILSKMKKYKWELVNDNKKIGGFWCKKATTSTQDSGDIIAWYTDELGISGGPKKYDNLPGVILYLQDKFTIYRATEIKVINEKSVFPERDKYTKVVAEDDLKKGVKEKTVKTNQNN